jgi:hypothetical protein
LVFFITHLTGTSPSRVFLQRTKKSFDVLVQLTAQMGDEKRLRGGAPVWLTGFPAFFIALVGLTHICVEHTMGWAVLALERP